jgi:thiol-disulfide isomerase/thioredoxin
MFYRFFAIFLFTALLGVAGFGFWPSAHSEDRGFAPIDPPQPAPMFTFEDVEGCALDLKDFRGRYVLLNIWETSCAPCVSEMPKLNALSKKLDPKVFTIIALSEDHDGSAAWLFFKRHDIDHLPVYHDDSGQAPFILHARGMPTTLLIDPHGMEIGRLEGAADWTQNTMVSFLQSQAAPR